MKPNAELTGEEMFQFIVTWVASFKTRKAAADEIGISDQFLCDILHKRRTIPDMILQHLNYTRKVSYMKVEKQALSDYLMPKEWKGKVKRI